MEHNLKGLYVLTDDILTPQDTLIAQAKALLDAGVRVLQLRDKCHTDAVLLPHAKALRILCDLYSATFIIND
jgi:thiamine-phosphate pyrophosphorylase